MPDAAGGRLPKLLVLYATGAAAPTEIVDAAKGLAQVTFACVDTDREVRAVARLLSAVAGCVWYTTGQELAELATGFDGVVTFAESRLSHLAVAVEAAGLPGPTSEVVRRLTHKPTQRAALAAAGLPVPRWRTVTSRDELIDAWQSLGQVPCVVKPVVGMASANTFPLHAGLDLAGLCVPAGEFIIEERLVGRRMPHRRLGDYCSAEVASSRGRHEALAVVARVPLAAPFREAGGYVPAPFDERDRDEVVRTALRAVDACGVSDGVCHVEIKLTDDGPRVIEVNGRLGGNVAHFVRQATGRDLVRDAILCALGRVPAAQAPERVPVGIVFRRFLYARQAEGVLSSIRGLDAVRALPKVTGVKRLLREGDDVSWTRGTAGAVVQVDGLVADLDELDRLLDAIDRELVIEASPIGSAAVVS